MTGDAAAPAVHPTAVVEAGAKLGAGVRVGAFCYIGHDVEVGDNTSFGPHCSVQGPTRIGRDNRFHGHCAIGGEPLIDLDRQSAWDKRRGSVGIEMIHERQAQTAEQEQVTEPARDQEARARAPPLDQCVETKCGSMNEARDVLRGASGQVGYFLKSLTDCGGGVVGRR